MFGIIHSVQSFFKNLFTISVDVDINAGSKTIKAIKQTTEVVGQTAETFSKISEVAVKGFEDVVQGTQLLSNAVTESSKEITTACRSLKETLEKPHVVDIGPNASRAISDVTIATAAIGGTYFGGKFVNHLWENYQRRNDSMYRQKLIDPSCGGLHNQTADQLNKFREGSWKAIQHLEEDGKESQKTYLLHYVRCFHEKDFSSERTSEINSHYRK